MLILRPEALVMVLTATRRDERDLIVFLTPHNMPKNGLTCRIVTRRLRRHCWYLRLAHWARDEIIYKTSSHEFSSRDLWENS